MKVTVNRYKLFKQIHLFYLVTCFLSIIMSVSSVCAGEGDFKWAIGIGESSPDNGYSVAVDSDGNVYTTGRFQGTDVDFDPGSGTTPHMDSAGLYDIFIIKMNAQGNLVWAKRIGGGTDDYGLGITVDASGNVYTTGSFSGTVDFDPGPGIANLTGGTNSEIFVSKLSSSGNYIWAKRMGGTLPDSAKSIVVDASGNVYTTGSFQGTDVDFDPGPGTTPHMDSAGSTDIFVSKLYSSGNFAWAKRIGGSGVDIANSIALDSNGNLYTTGQFVGTVDFDPAGSGKDLDSAGSSDVFVSKLSSSGDYVWAKAMGGTGIDTGYSISVDSTGNVYTSGKFRDIVDFDPGAGTKNLTSAGTDDIFISKLNGSGNFVWAKRMGGNSSDVGYGITVDATGNVYTTGYFQGTNVDFDPTDGTAYNLTSEGGYDIFVSKLENNGDFVWAKAMGGTSEDLGQSIAVDDSEGVYVTGYFFGTADFDPGSGTESLESNGINDIFVVHLSGTPSFPWAMFLPAVTGNSSP